jgi:Uma2 family endonuclease
MNWQEVMDNKSLRDLPFKIELNRRGNIEMSPATNMHALWQAEIAGLLRELQRGKGKPFTEASVDTPEGVKVPDVAWASRAFIAQHGYATPYPRSPEICVEIISPSNSELEMRAKAQLYFDQGAFEVWLCDLGGRMRFLGASGDLERSQLVVGFPTQLEL